MACQFNSAELIQLSQLDHYVQDALDLIEFANGDATTAWGKIRAGMGHPAPFNLKMLGVGNENWGPQYIERLKIFTKAIKAKYPNIKLINSSGTDPNGARFDYLNSELRSMNADIIDEHYYRKPEWFLQNASRYDNYDRNSSKIFAGEYAAHSDKSQQATTKNNLEAAIAEAAFMTGLERNADVVMMASYAPLFANAEAWQWSPDLIWVDNLTIYGTPDYYVQKLYSLNKGTNVVPATMDGKAIAGQDSLYVSAVIDKNTSDVIIKLVNAGGIAISKTITIAGVKKLAASASLNILKSGAVTDVNSFARPEAVSPVTSSVSLKGKELNVVLPAHSFSVYRIAMK